VGFFVTFSFKRKKGLKPSPNYHFLKAAALELLDNGNRKPKGSFVNEMDMSRNSHFLCCTNIDRTFVFPKGITLSCGYQGPIFAQTVMCLASVMSHGWSYVVLAIPFFFVKCFSAMLQPVVNNNPGL
jgi:hypothetical protein